MPRWSVGANQQWQRQVSGRVPEGCFQFDAFASLSGPPTASAFACGSASATPPQGGQPQGLCRCAGGQGGGYWLVPPPHQPSPAARLLRLPLKGGNCRACKDGQGGRGGGYWLAPPPHQPSPAGSASATPPPGGSDTEASYAGLKNHSPLEGESARGRSPQSSRRGAAAASHRAGGGQTRRPVEPEGANAASRE